MLPKSTTLQNQGIFPSAKINKSASNFYSGAWLITSLLVFPSFFNCPASAVPVTEVEDTPVVSSVVQADTPIATPATNPPQSVSEARFLKPVVSRTADDFIILNRRDSEELFATDFAQAQQPVAHQPADTPITPNQTQLEIPSVTPTLDKPTTPGASQIGKPATLSFYDRVIKNKLSINVEQYYYDWNDDLGNHGSQSVTPITLTYSTGNFDFGIRRAYIDSRLDGVITFNGLKVGSRDGQVGTWSDTSLSLAYTFKQLSWPVRFNLDLNLPTGKATLTGKERNAIMDGALVQQTRFGEGFNIAPGISVTHALGKKDVIGAGVSYIFRGKFDPNGDVINDEIKPGNELVGSLQYQHTENNWLLIGGLIYTNSGVTQRDGSDYYRKGERIDANATLVI